MSNSIGLMIGLIFGSIGVGYCVYGKKQSSLVAFVAGILLMGMPYVIENNVLLFVLCILVMLSPKFIKL